MLAVYGHGKEAGDEGAGAAKGRHDERVSSIGIKVKGEIDEDKLNKFMAKLLENPKDIYRMKGVLAMHENPYKLVFQGVHEMTFTEPLALWKEGEERINKMVFIGKDLDKAMIRAGFEGCLVGAGDAAAAEGGAAIAAEPAAKRQKTEE